MSASLKRRWFRYRLRTLFLLLTILCVWLGWNFNQLHQRNTLILAIQPYMDKRLSQKPLSRLQLANIQNIAPPIGTSLAIISSRAEGELPFRWRLLGAKKLPYTVARKRGATQEDVRMIERFLPELEVVYYPIAAPHLVTIDPSSSDEPTRLNESIRPVR